MVSKYICLKNRCQSISSMILAVYDRPIEHAINPITTFMNGKILYSVNNLITTMNIGDGKINSIQTICNAINILIMILLIDNPVCI